MRPQRTCEKLPQGSGLVSVRSPRYFDGMTRVGTLLLVIAVSRGAAGDDHCAAPPTDDHDDAMPMDHHHASDAGVRVVLDVVTADYNQHLYAGSYWGAIPGASIARGRLALGASVPMYHVLENGARVDGLGDVRFHAHARILTNGAFSTGAMLMVTAPTGDQYTGLGMGHVMVMPEAWASWSAGRIALAGSLGYGYALGGAAAHAHHGGGMWPIVDPMNASEITFGGSAMLRAAGASAGVQASGGLPTGMGDARLISGIAVAWSRGWFEGRLAVDRGLLGDPFGTRAVLGTAAKF